MAAHDLSDRAAGWEPHDLYHARPSPLQVPSGRQPTYLSLVLSQPVSLFLSILPSSQIWIGGGSLASPLNADHQKPPPAGHRAPPAEGRLGRAATSPHHDIPPTVLLLLPLPDPVPSSLFPSVVDGIRPLRRRDGHHPRRDAAVVSFL